MKKSVSYLLVIGVTVAVTYVVTQVDHEPIFTSQELVTERSSRFEDNLVVSEEAATESLLPNIQRETRQFPNNQQAEITFEEWERQSQAARDWFKAEIPSDQPYHEIFDNDYVSDKSIELVVEIENALQDENGLPIYGEDFQTFVECRTKVCRITASSSLEDADRRRQEMMFGLVRTLPPHIVATLDTENEAFYLFVPELDAL